MANKPQYGLLIDYEYCTGCMACTVACQQEYDHRAGVSGMRVIEQVQELPNGKPYLCFLPFPTETCILCKPRVNRGEKPACVKHCMARVIEFGKLDELAQKLGSKPRMVLWSPR